jgi:ligand-binding sensor domain-containing protein/signal transduction histidine kinase
MNGAQTTKAAVATAIFLACCSIAVALNPSLETSQYAHNSWNVREGFFRGPVNAIEQTPDGYLWVGTEFGLYRFDGVRSVLWHPRGNQSLPSEAIRKLFVALDGTLWVGTDAGLCSLKDGELTLYPDLPAERVDSVVQDSQGTIWTGLDDTPNWRLCSIQNRVVHCSDDNGSLGLGRGALLSDKKGNLWAGTGTGLWRWAPGSPESIPLSGPASEIHSIIQDRDGAVLIASRAGIIRITDRKAAAYRLPDFDAPLNPFCLLRDRDGGLWIGTKDRGLLHVSKESTDHFGRAHGLSSDYISALFEDREGNIWIGTANGLDRFREFAISTISVVHGYSVPSVESVLTDTDGSVWLGTRNGIDRWQNGRLILYRKRRVQTPSTVRQIIDHGLPGDLQAAFYKDVRGRIWAFSPAGASYLDERENFIRVPNLPGGFAQAIGEDSEGAIWVSQDQGLFRLLNRGKIEQIPWSKFGAQNLATALAGDPSRGGMWLGFSDGGLIYLNEGQIRERYAAAEGLGKGRVNKLQVDKDGTFWVGTNGGLSRLKSGRITTLTSQNGLPCEAVQEFVRDNSQSIWLLTPCGVVRIARSELEAWETDPKRTIRTTVLDSSDGLTALATPGALSPRMGKSTDGRIWFVSGDGASVIDPADLPINELAPPVHLEEIKANDEMYNASNGLRLPPQVRSLEIKYTALSLMAPEKVRFRYKLDGVDPDWRDVINERKVQYSNLRPGTYRFRVMACNNSGVWNEEGALLDFSIAPTFYQRTSFRVLCVVALMALLFVAYQLRVRQLARQFKMTLEARVGERTRIARELHDTLLQSFQGLLLRFQSASNLIPTRPGEAKQRLDNALDLAAAAITEGRDAVQGLRLSAVETNDLAKGLSAIAKELMALASTADSPIINVDVQGVPRDLSPIVRDEAYRIAGEALRNAFHHAEARLIEVEVNYERRQFSVQVRDDGKGFDEESVARAALAGHFGLPGMRERAKVVGGRLEVWTKINSGTQIQLKIPGAIAYDGSGRRAHL